MKVTGLKSLTKKDYITCNTNFDTLYTLEKNPIGAGSFGTIKVGIHKQTNSKRAVKILHKNIIENISNFKEEVEIMRHLDHH